jgi:hypothetical protein
MSHTIEWFLPQRVIFMHIEGDVTVAEIKAVSNEITALLDAGNAPVHLLVDDQKVQKFAIGLAKINKSVAFMRHPALGSMVGVGEIHPMVAYIVPVISQILGAKLLRRKNLDDALEYLKQIDSTLAIEPM